MIVDTFIELGWKLDTLCNTYLSGLESKLISPEMQAYLKDFTSGMFIPNWQESSQFTARNYR